MGFSRPHTSGMRPPCLPGLLGLQTAIHERTYGRVLAQALHLAADLLLADRPLAVHRPGLPGDADPPEERHPDRPRDAAVVVREGPEDPEERVDDRVGDQVPLEVALALDPLLGETAKLGVVHGFSLTALAHRAPGCDSVREPRSCSPLTSDGEVA